MFKNELKGYVNSSNLIYMNPAGEDIFVLKYKKKVFYNGLWNRFIAECRGSIVDADFNLIAYPFTKIYNYGIEKEAPKVSADTKVTAFRKVNGFMAAMTWYKDDVLVSTTGSTDSPYVAMAKEMMLTHAAWCDWQALVEKWAGQTLMFECVHPEDPHIVPEKAGMYILGYRMNEYGSKVGHDPFVLQDIACEVNCFYAESIATDMAQLQALAKAAKHEGYVFYTDEGVSSKIKSPYYLTSKWVARNPRTDKLVDLKNDIKHNLDEEYYGLVDAIRANIVQYTAMEEQARLSWVRNYMEAI